MISCEDLPQPHNRLVLDPEQLDADGDPSIRIRYRVSENSRRMLYFMASRAIESLSHSSKPVPTKPVHDAWSPKMVGTLLVPAEWVTILKRRWWMRG
jgi:hypothetical protein